MRNNNLMSPSSRNRKFSFKTPQVHSPNIEAGERSFTELGTRFYQDKNHGLKRVPPPYISDGQDPAPVLAELKVE